MSHTVTVQLVDQNGRLLIAIWHLNATACNIQKREGKNDVAGAVGVVRFVMCNGPTLTKGEEVSLLAGTARAASPRVPKETVWTGGGLGLGAGGWAEAMRLQFPGLQKGQCLQGTVASACLQKGKGYSRCKDACSGHRRQKNTHMGHFPKGTPDKADLNIHPRDARKATKRPDRF